jgi:hypothetical protein
MKVLHQISMQELCGQFILIIIKAHGHHKQMVGDNGIGKAINL